MIEAIQYRIIMEKGDITNGTPKTAMKYFDTNAFQLSKEFFVIFFRNGAINNFLVTQLRLVTVHFTSA